MAGRVGYKGMAEERPLPYPRLEVEQIVQEGLFLFVGVLLVIVPVLVVTPFLVIVPVIAVALVIRFVIGSFGIVLPRPFHEFLQFTSVQPDAPAVGAVINLDAFFLTHQQRDVTDGTLHGNGKVKFDKIGTDSFNESSGWFGSVT
jgi:hypothetical protein